MMFVGFVDFEIFLEVGFLECSYAVFLARFICSILLHMKLESDVRVSLIMMKYDLKHRSLFDDAFVPFMYAFMKNKGALLTEILNMLLMCSR